MKEKLSLPVLLFSPSHDLPRLVDGREDGPVGILHVFRLDLSLVVVALGAHSGTDQVHHHRLLCQNKPPTVIQIIVLNLLTIDVPSSNNILVDSHVHFKFHSPSNMHLFVD